MEKGGANSSGSRRNNGGARRSTGARRTAGQQSDVGSGARAPDQFVARITEFESQIPPHAMRLLKFSTTVNIINSLTFMFDDMMKLIFGVTYSDLWLSRKLVYYVVMFLWIKPVVDCFSRRYGYWLPNLFAIFLAFTNLCLYYYAA